MTWTFEKSRLRFFFRSSFVSFRTSRVAILGVGSIFAFRSSFICPDTRTRNGRTGARQTRHRPNTPRESPPVCPRICGRTRTWGSAGTSISCHIRRIRSSTDTS